MKGIIALILTVWGGVLISSLSECGTSAIAEKNSKVSLNSNEVFYMGIMDRIKVRQLSIKEEEKRASFEKKWAQKRKAESKTDTEHLIQQSITIIEEYVETKTKYGRWAGLFKDKQSVNFNLNQLLSLMKTYTRVTSEGEIFEPDENHYEKDWKQRLRLALIERHHNWKVRYYPAAYGMGVNPEHYTIEIRRVIESK